MIDYLSEFVAQLELAPASVELELVGDYTAGYRRGVKTILRPPSVASVPLLELDEARRYIADELDAYARLARPDHMLLVKAQPGVGKTHAAVRLLERLAGEGRRVLYCAPRHDFIHDLRKIATRPGEIYEWLPRQLESETKAETCRHTEAISSWLHRDYPAMDFCSRVCGWDYVGKACPFHAQKRRPEPVVMGQHQHLTGGHPLDFHFLIGDESPLAVFQRQWVIPQRFVLPPGVDYRDPLSEVLHALSLRCADEGTYTSGKALIDSLGGADAVMEACTRFVIPASAVAQLPRLRSADDVEDVPFFHLPTLVPLLLREAEAVARQAEYPARIIAGNGRLQLLLRRAVNDKMPPHVVWLDATGNPAIYRELFGRPVHVVEPRVKLQGRIVQVTDRANGKHSLKAEDKAAQLIAQVQTIIADNDLQRPGIVTFQALRSHDALQGVSALHFYAARGTNAQQGVDGLIVAGTPQPSLLEIEKLASMIFFDRMTRFDKTWTVKDVPYNFAAQDGTGRAMPTSGFWHDPDLQNVLWQSRDAELIQAVHRARLTTRPVTVWLLSNLPIAELPPCELLSIRDLLQAPAGVDPFLWGRVVDLAEALCAERGYMTAAELAVAFDIDPHTAQKYVKLLQEMPGWEPAVVRKGRGRPPLAAQQSA